MFIELKSKESEREREKLTREREKVNVGKDVQSKAHKNRETKSYAFKMHIIKVKK